MRKFNYDFNRTPCNKTSDIPANTTHIIFENDKYYSDHGYPEDGSTAYDMLRVQAFPSKEDAVAYMESEMNGKYNSKDISTFRLVEVNKVITPSKKVSLEL